MACSAVLKTIHIVLSIILYVTKTTYCIVIITRASYNRIQKQLLLVPVLAPTPEAAFVEEPFKSSGGYKTLKREFGELIDPIVSTINDNLYVG